MKRKMTKRWISLALCLAMILSFVPGITPFAQAAITVGGKVADLGTMDKWMERFDPDNITTTHAGGVWVDKSVFVDQNGFVNLKDGEGNPITLSTKDDSFLIALSALAANSVVVGQGAVPTDTVFVLDVSNSMSSTDIQNMVSATNSAIRSLMAANEGNRVAVVTYGTTASQLMPLNHYTGVEVDGVELFLRYSGFNAITTAIQYTVEIPGGTGRPGRPNRPSTQTVTDYPTYLSASGVPTDLNKSVSVGGGTYIQGGLWLGYEQLKDAAVSDNRAPVVVLMSDGAPTYTTNQYSNVPDSATHGGGNYSTTGDGFVTQLTAAYVKAQLKTKYGSAYMYTLGLGVDDNDIAKAVLDPVNAQAADIAAEWTEYLAGSAQIYLPPRGDNSSDVTLTKAAGITSSAYNDRYFSASQSNSLPDVFQNIVNEISLRVGYYPTRLDDNGSNYSGYVTFMDQLGSGMEVRDIIGLKHGDVIYTGQKLVDYLESGAFGTKDAPTDLGNNLVWAVKERFGIADTQEVWALLEYAYGKTLGYLDNGAWDNYLGWYGDAQGNYLGYDPNNLSGTPVYYNACYGMLGTVGNSTTAADMMYITIQVSTRLSDGSQAVNVRIPASLLPVVTYEVHLDGETVETSQNVMVKYNTQTPLSLIYEAGVRADVNALNIGNYAQYDAATGKYYLYTNTWGGQISGSVSDNSHTWAFFEPSAENEHYYFTEDSVVFQQTGTDTYAPITEVAAGQSYYVKHRIFEVTNKATGAAKITYVYEQISTENHSKIQKDETTGQFYIPKGTVRRGIHQEDITKAQNITGTLPHVSYHMLGSATQDGVIHQQELIYLGNNGRMEVQMPQGIAISKELAEGTTVPAGTKFTFEVALTGTVAAQYETITVAADGTQTEGTVAVNGGKATVTLEANETVYILGLAAGTGYTVSEQVPDGYLLDRVVGSSTGAVTAQTVTEIIFINGLRTYSDLTITKQVTYNNGVVYDANNVPSFRILVTLKDGDKPYTKPVIVEKDGQQSLHGVNEDGQMLVQVADHKSVVLKDLPVGVTYTITEQDADLAKGYKLEGGVGLTGTITEDNQSTLVINSYTPEKVTINDTEPAISVNVDKILKDLNGSEITDWTTGNPAYSFQFKLERYNGTWIQQGNALTLTAPIKTPISMAGTEFTTAGEHFFRVSETVGDRNGMTYDRTLHIFKVVVTDADLDGYLEIADVVTVDHAQVTKTADKAVWIVDTTFTNTYIPNSTKVALHVDKELTGRDLAAGEFTFNLYAADAAFNKGALLESAKNGMNGDVFFTAIPYAQADVYFYLIEEVNDNAHGIGYDPKNTIKVKVTISDVNGALQAKVEADSTAITANEGVYTVGTFKNTFTPDPVEVTLKANKVLTGKTLADNMFRFQLKDSNDNPIGEAVYNKADGTITFPKQTYTAAGTYTYSICEINDGKGGFTYDAAVLRVTVEVTKDQTTGLLSAKVGQMDVTGGTYNAGTFHNSYAAAEATLTITGNKALEGRDLADGEFSFLLKDEAGKILESVKNADDKFTFAELTFTKAGTYIYYVSEIRGDLGGITYDDAVYTVTVTVTDVDGQLVATAKIGSTDATIANNTLNVGIFRNKYTAKAVSAAITGTKELTGKRLLADQFSFQLKASNGTVLQTVRNGIAPAQGNGEDGDVVVHDSDILFAPIKYTQVGTHTYKIVEVNEAKGGYTYDLTEYTATVKITDDGEGQLQAAVTYSGQGSIIFKNSYSTKGVSVILNANKTLNEQAPGNEKFDFILKDAEGKEIETKQNAADGKIVFTKLDFDKEGTYVYTIAEVNAGKNGYNYDNTVYTVTITVTDVDGQLVATAKIGTADATITGGVLNVGTFKNTYKAGTTSVTLNANKTLNGEAASEKFEFILKDAQGKEIETKQNGTDGKIVFTKLDFEKVGTYTYTVSEINGGKNGYTYDTTVYTVTITVTDVDGQLVATAKVGTADATITGGVLNVGTFKNIYVSDENPKTADDSMLMLWGLGMMVSAMAVLVLCVSAKKKEMEA